MPYSRYLVGQLPWYSALIVLGICLAIWLSTMEEKRLGLPKDTVLDLALWLVPLGIIGARVYYVLFSWDQFRGDPLSVLYIWRGGLAIYGGLIGGMAALLLFARRRKLNALTLLDMVVPGVALAQAIGRWGNFFNMEAYGPAVTDAAWQWFPFAVRIPEGGAETWHVATFFLESVWDLLVFGALMLLRKRKRRDGDLLLAYALLYGTGRFVIEGLRTDSLMAGGGLRISQLLSLIAMTAVVLCFVRRMRLSRAVRIPAAAAALLLFGAGLTMMLRGSLAVLPSAGISLGLAILGWTAYAVKRRDEACRRDG